MDEGCSQCDIRYETPNYSKSGTYTEVIISCKHRYDDVNVSGLFLCPIGLGKGSGPSMVAPTRRENRNLASSGQSPGQLDSPISEAYTTRCLWRSELRMSIRSTEEATNFVWHFVIRDVDRIWDIRRGTPDLRGQNPTGMRCPHCSHWEGCWYRERWYLRQRCLLKWPLSTGHVWCHTEDGISFRKAPHVCHPSSEFRQRIEGSSRRRSWWRRSSSCCNWLLDQ